MISSAGGAQSEGIILLKIDSNSSSLSSSITGALISGVVFGGVLFGGPFSLDFLGGALDFSWIDGPLISACFSFN